MISSGREMLTILKKETYQGFYKDYTSNSKGHWREQHYSKIINKIIQSILHVWNWPSYDYNEISLVGFEKTRITLECTFLCVLWKDYTTFILCPFIRRKKLLFLMFVEKILLLKTSFKLCVVFIFGFR